MTKATSLITLIAASLLMTSFAFWAASGTALDCQPEDRSRLVRRETSNGRQARGCTIFTLSKGGKVFFGGNDDYIEPDSYYWVDPGQAGAYGSIWIGTPDNVQQGVNEMGLAYDANGLPRIDVNPHPERTPFRGGYNSYPVQILRETSSVSEVIQWIETHEWRSYMHDQMHFADASGDAVIVSAGPEGELVFTRKPAGDSFLVSTNFNVADPTNSHGFPCWRHDAAQRALTQLLDLPGETSAEEVVAVLDATHVEAASAWTIGSMLADLTTGTVYLYYFHQFDEPVVLNIAEQLANPPEPGPLSRLFPDQVQAEAERRYQQIQGRASTLQVLGVVWLGAGLAGLMLFLVLSMKRPRGRAFWVIMLLVLGPLALLIWFAAGRGDAQSAGQMALQEALGDIAPTVVAYIVMLLLILLALGSQPSDLLQVVLIAGLPLAMALFLFHGLLLAPTTEVGYFKLVWAKLPGAIVSANLGMAGVNAFSTPLVGAGLSQRAIQASTIATAGTLLLISAVGALAGIAILWLYNLWTVRRGLRSWSVLTSDKPAAFLGWRRLGWWIPVSYVMLIGGIAASVVLQGMLRG